MGAQIIGPVLAVLLSMAQADTSRRQQINVETTVLQYLEQLADTADRETARCVLGHWDADTLHFDGIAHAPWLIREETETTVTWMWWGCPVGTMALWHSHPRRIVQQRLSRGMTFNWQTCGVSGPDLGILMLPHAPPVLLISIGRKRTCLFARTPSGLKQVPIQYQQPIPVRRT